MHQIKRPLHYSTDSRTIVKSPNYALSSKKSILPTLPETFSPGLPKSPRLINSKIRSPRLKKTANSHFQLKKSHSEANPYQFPKPEECQINPLDLKIPIPVPVKSSTFVSEPEKNPKKPEPAFTTSNSPVILEQNTKFPVIKADDFEPDSLVETHYEEIQSLKGILSEQKKAYEKLEELYYSDTNELKGELAKLRQNVKKLETEKIKIKTKVEDFKKKLEDMEKEGNTKVNEAEEKLECIQIVLKEKNSELFQISEILRKVQVEKKSKEEGLKEIHRQLAIAAESMRIVENDLSCHKRELKITNDCLMLEKEKTKQLVQQATDFAYLNEKCVNLEESLKSLQKSSDFTLQNYNSLKSKYHCLKENFDQSEALLKSALEKSPEPSSAILPSNNQKLRRTLTLSTVSSNGDSQQRENFQRLYSKIVSLEESLQYEKLEKEKLKKNLDYCQKQVNEKNEILEKVKKAMTEEMEFKVNEARKEVSDRVKEICGRFEWYLRTLSEKFKCQVCKVDNCVRRVSLNCGHLYCKACSVVMDLCPCCSVKSKSMKPKIFKETCYSNSRMIEILSDILLIINNKVS